MKEKILATQATTSLSERGPLILEEKKFCIGEVVFGVPRLDCRGVGICRVNLPTDNHRNCKKCQQCKSYSATIINPGDRGLCFVFKKKALGEGVLEQFFGQGVFLVSEPFYLSHSLRMALSTRVTKIPAGIYPVKEDRRLVWVEF